MIKKTVRETWVPLKFKGFKQMRNQYAISSLGRVVSFKENIHEDGKLLAGSLTSGYKTLNLHVGDSSMTLYVHREVATHFNKKKSPKDKYVIHLNHIKTDNRSKNLKWVNQEEAMQHQQKSPARKAYKEIQRTRTQGPKLNAAKVKSIRAILVNPRRKLTNKQLAEKFGVSEMTIYRIQSKESWGHI